MDEGAEDVNHPDRNRVCDVQQGAQAVQQRQIQRRHNRTDHYEPHEL
jgi:hypothetical protein